MTRVALIALLISLPLTRSAHAQGRRGGDIPASAQAAAPIDLTGYWVSVVTEDWRYRMVTPAKGDYPSIPLNTEGRKVADAWNPANDEAAGNQCKSYGAGNIMRQPGRVHIAWDSDTVLKVEADAGTQTRQFYFTSAPTSGDPSWQGISSAQWEFAGGPRGRGKATGGSLKVVTTRMRPGYLQKNGVPYSASAVITENFHRVTEPTGDSWMIVTTLVEDPQYLTARFIRSTHFKMQAGSAGWSPSACEAR
jgi:hypothetical protein